jgi:hypothetical protein
MALWLKAKIITRNVMPVTPRVTVKNILLALGGVLWP